jgi:endonuclease YncB( thermonuclease family)
LAIHEGKSLASPQRQYRTARARPGPSRPLEYAVAAAFLIAVSVLAAALARISSETNAGIATAVDGDSLRMGGKRIRLEGIDAPELGQTCMTGGRETNCGRQARDHLRALIAGQRVVCEGWQSDKYGRLLARCTARSIELNAAMVRDGWAVAYGDFDMLQAEAQTERRGLWQGDFETPREWRRKHAHIMEEGEQHTASLTMLLDTVRQRISSWLGF